MTTIRLHIAYDGTDFHGWQRQPDVVTVEGEIRSALARLLDASHDDLDFQGASRTDSGVHAVGQVASLTHDTDRTRWDFVRGVNALTPDSICINHAEEVSDDFNARHDSRGKHYRFRIWNHRFVHPLERNRSWCFPREMDVVRMNEAAQRLLGEHDFAAFRASDCQAETTVREMTRVDVTRNGAMITIDVEGTAFLKYMVRIMVGTLVEVGTTRREPAWIDDVLAGRDRAAAGPTAQPEGLTLMEIFYPDHPWDTRPKLGLRVEY